jgi:ribosomal protein S18 acetylase RimI-like enzyme
MLTLGLATTQQHYEELLNLICHQNSSCLEVKFDWIQLTCEQFGDYFRSIGAAYRICLDQLLVGMCWVEQTDRILYVYGIIIQPEYQSRGYGQQALELLEYLYQDRIDAIELNVHSSNPRAKSFYKRIGFKVIEYNEENGFYLVHKKCGSRILDPFSC